MPFSPGERTKAAQLRKRVREGQPLSPEQAAWLSDYEARIRDELPPRDSAGMPIGASSASRVVHVEEHAASVGSGSAAEVAAAAALAREEGKRLDYLVRAGMDALIKACDLHRQMAATLLERTQALEAVHLSMLDAVREQYLARTQAEIDAMQKSTDDEQSIANQLGGMLVEKMLNPQADKNGHK